MSEPKKHYCGDPPHELERKRIEREDQNRRVSWVRARRDQYQRDVDYMRDLRRANDSWDAIQGPDGKGVNG